MSPLRTLVLIFACIVLYLLFKQRKPDMRKIILLTTARCNGTIILRAFGQDSNVAIQNEVFTYFNSEKKRYKPFDEKDSDHEAVVERIIHESYIGNQRAIYHEMAGDLSYQEILTLRDHGFVIVGLVRHPRSQLKSLMNVCDKAHHGAMVNMFMIGWHNLKHYLDTEVFDYYIDSEQYLSHAGYRKKIHELLDLNVTEEMLQNMTRYHGQDFHDICTITSLWNNPTDPNINKWNAKAGSSLTLNPDVSEHIKDDMVPNDLKMFLQQAETTYALFLARC